jgi:hypothetical protein
MIKKSLPNFPGKKLLLGLAIVFVVYITLGSFDTSVIKSDAHLIPEIKVVSAVENSTTQLETLDIKKFEGFPGQKIEEYLKDVSLSDSNTISQDVFTKYIEELALFNNAIKHPYYKNPYVTGHDSLKETLRFPQFSLYHSLTKLSLAKIKKDFVSGSLNSVDAQVKLNQLISFGNNIQQGSMSVLEFAFGSSIISQTEKLGKLLDIALIQVSPELVQQAKSRIVLFEYMLIKNSYGSNFKLEGNYIGMSKIPFFYHPRETANLFITSYTLAHDTTVKNTCNQEVSSNMPWYDWLMPNSLGKYTVVSINMAGVLCSIGK